MTTLVLLRHGQTDWNLLHRYQGLTDIPLNATGEQQAREANSKLKDFHFDAVYCSDLERAQTTARLALKGICPYDKDKMPREYVSAMEADPEGFRFPEGESLLDVEKRIRPFYDEILRKHPDETVLLVAHGSLLSIVRFIAANEPVLDKNRKRLKNAEPVVLKVS